MSGRLVGNRLRQACQPHSLAMTVRRCRCAFLSSSPTLRMPKWCVLSVRPFYAASIQRASVPHVVQDTTALMCRERDFTLTDSSDFQNPMRGWHASSITCTGCDRSTPWRAQHFIALSLSIPRVQAPYHTVQSCMEAYFHGELISDYRCDGCVARVAAWH